MSEAKYMVFDARNNNNEIGPYCETDAKKLAEDLNQMVYANGFGQIFGPASKIVGPFYVRARIVR